MNSEEQRLGGLASPDTTSSQPEFKPISNALAILVVEDREADADLVLKYLRHHYSNTYCDIVRSKNELKQKLSCRHYDLVICDYLLGGWTAIEALRISKEASFDGVFVVVSASVGEEVAVECIKNGAHDFLRKDHISRLPLVVSQAFQLREQQRRRTILLQADISENKHTQQALHQSERQLRALFDAAMDAIVVVDDDLRIVAANPPACHLFGVSPPEFGGQRLSSFCEDTSAAETLWRKLKTDKVFRSEMIIVTNDGAKRLLEASVTPNFLDGKHLWLLRDVSEDRLREEHLRHASKLEAIGRLAGGVAHDFNNLLMVITSYSELASALENNPPKLKGYLAEIQNASKRAADLTQQLLTFSRKQVLAPAVLDFNSVLESALKMLNRLIGEDIRLVLDLDKGLRPIVSDRMQIEQVIMNLAVNARDAMPNGGTLRIRTTNETVPASRRRSHSSTIATTPPGDYVVIEVQDTGDGVPNEIQGKVFEPFFTTKASGHRTGLGLATVYGIVKQSRGFIWLNSEPGSGAKFTIYFPVAVEPVSKQTVPLQAGTESLTQTILLVEDEEQMLSALSTYLQAQGFEVHGANGPQSALDIAHRTSHLDLVLTDVIMPGMNGKELASRIAKIHPNATILFMTGYIDSDWAQDNHLEPNDAVLLKPFKLDALMETIARVRGGKLGSAPIA